MVFIGTTEPNAFNFLQQYLIVKGLLLNFRKLYEKIIFRKKC